MTVSLTQLIKGLRDVCLATLAITLISGVVSAANPIDRLDITRDKDTVKMNDDVSFTITALDADGNLVSAKNKLDVVISKRTGEVKDQVRLRKGQATLQLQFDTSEVVIVEVVDQTNADLAASDMFRVKYVSGGNQ